MKDEFEYKVQQKAEQFSLMPSQHIWDGVEEAIEKKKKRRPIIFWWLLPLVGLMGIGFYYFHQSNYIADNNSTECVEDYNLSSDNKVNIITAEKNISQQHKQTIIAEQGIGYTHPQSGEATKNATEIKKVLTNCTIQNNPAFMPAEKGNMTNETSMNLEPSKQIVANENKVVIFDNDSANSLNIEPIITTLAVSMDSSKIAKKDSIILTKKKSSANRIDSTSTKKLAQSKKLIPYMIISGGMSNFKASNVNGGSIALATSNDPNGGLYNNPPSTTTDFSSKGYYFSAGVGLEYVWNNNVSINTQLMYQYIQRNIKARGIPDSATINYYPGTGKNYYNSLHQLKLEQGILFHFSKSKLFYYVQPEIGYSIAGNIGSNWMAADSWKGVYVNDYSSVQTIVFSVYTALWFPLYKGWVGGVTYSENLSALSDYHSTSISGKYFGLSIKKRLSSLFKTSK